MPSKCDGCGGMIEGNPMDHRCIGDKPRRKISKTSKIEIPYESLYRELLMAVETKYTGESRHQTALRYIQQAECRDNKQTALDRQRDV